MKKWKPIDGMKATIICPYCLKPILKKKHLTKDHEPPKSRQKELGQSSLIYCCKKCNNEKGALTADEYKEWKCLNTIRNGGKQK